MTKKTCNLSVTRLNSLAKGRVSRGRCSIPHFAYRTKCEAQPGAEQLTLWESQQKPETEYPLKIEPLPPALQWWKEEHFWLVHIESGLRVPGTWSLAEAELIQDLSRQWDWRVDKDRRVACGLQLLALADAVCKRSSHQIGGEA